MSSRGRKPESVEAMFERLSIPEPNTGCHVWQGKIGTGGYAYIAYREGEPINGHRKRRWRKAATVSLELDGRPRPEGLEAGHVPPCYNPACVNPAHLRWVTRSQNLSERRPYARYKGNVCKKGHPLPDQSLRNGNGSCPICYKEYQAAYRATHKAETAAYGRDNATRINAQRRYRRDNPK